MPEPTQRSLPQAVAYNAPAVPEAMSRLTLCLSSDDPAGSLWDLARRIGALTALADLGFQEQGRGEGCRTGRERGARQPTPGGQ